MATELLIINDTGAKIPFETPATGEWVTWQTCVRKVHFGNVEWISKMQELNMCDAKIEVYQGLNAYAFCLETLCGLNSPMVGETEVFGQFKQLCDQTSFTASPWGYKLRDLFKQIVADVKSVRKTHLLGLGSQSYGSVTRRHFKGLTEINIIGAGLLTKEILPWLRKLDLRVRVHCRRPDVARQFLSEFGEISIEALTSDGHPNRAGGLVVAAPLASVEAEAWIDSPGNNFTAILDFRGESKLDPINGNGVVSLADVFCEIKESQAHVACQVKKAKKMIGKLSEEKTLSVSNRPFGWDDLCHP